MKRCILLILIMAMAAVGAACQPTPEETVVVGKNSDEFYEKILVKNNDTNSYEYDYYYYDEFVSKDNKVKMQIDAKIITPVTTKLPVIKISPSPIGDEMIKLVVNTFTEGKSGFYPTVFMNKEDTEMLKIRLKSMLMNEEKLYEQYGSRVKVERFKSKLEKTITYLDEDYNSKISEQKKIPATLDLRPFQFYLGGDVNVINEELSMSREELNERSESETNLYLLFDAELSDGKYVRVGIYNEYPYTLKTYNGQCMFYMPKSQIHVVNSNISMNIHPTYILQTLPFLISLPCGGLDVYYSEISKTIEYSIYIATEKLKELGADDFYVVSTYEEFGLDVHVMYDNELAQGDITTDLTFDEYCEENDIGTKFHKITFKPYYYGVPLLEANQAFYDDEIYHSPMEYEVISVRVSQDGIAEFKWTNPTDISNVINDDVKIIPLESAIENAKRFMKLKYNIHTMMPLDSDSPDYSGINGNINIDTIRLGLAGIPTADSTNEYLLIPVWNFYGSYSVESDDEGVIYAFDLTRIPFISINAIDGSIIHQTAYVIEDLT